MTIKSWLTAPKLPMQAASQRWFRLSISVDAQLSDHARHAMPEHGGHSLHKN